MLRFLFGVARLDPRQNLILERLHHTPDGLASRSSMPWAATRWGADNSSAALARVLLRLSNPRAESTSVGGGFILLSSMDTGLHRKS